MTTQNDAKFWDRAAPKYAASKIADTGGYERSLERMRALLNPDFTVLELGCGTGSTALRLAGGVQGDVRLWNFADGKELKVMLSDGE